MGRGFTSIPQREATPEILPPAPPATGFLGSAVMLGPLETQTLISPSFTTIKFGEQATADLIENTLGIEFEENGIILPENGVYTVTLSFYPVYEKGNQPEWRNVEIVNGGTKENAFFDFQTLNSRGNEALTGEQITALVQMNGHKAGHKNIQFDFSVNGAAEEFPVLIIVEELIIVGFAGFAS